MILSIGDIYFGILVLSRVAALISMIPMFGGRLVPTQVQVIFAGAIAIMLYPFLYQELTLPSHALGFIGGIFTEIFVGLLMGFAVRIIFFIVEFAGTIISTETGLMRSDSFDPFTQTHSTTSGTLFFYLAGLLIMLTGSHYLIIDAFVHSYSIVTIGSFLPNIRGVESLVRATSDVFHIGLKMAAPIVALSFVINMTFAVLGKAIPKMNVFMVSFSVRIFAGLSLLLLTVGLIAQYMTDYINKIPKLMIDFLSF